MPVSKNTDVPIANPFIQRMEEPVHFREKGNRSYLIWFLVAVLIALLPWLILA